MNSRTMFAVVFITLGVVILAYSGLSFNTPGQPIDALGLHIETTNHHFVPPVVGALMLVGGIVVLAVTPKRA